MHFRGCLVDEKIRVVGKEAKKDSTLDFNLLSISLH